MKFEDIITLELSPLATNCYIVPVGGGKAVVIDPADDYPAIAAELERAKLKTEAILLTHGHFDHIGAAASLRDGEDKVALYKEYEKTVKDAEKKGKEPPAFERTAPCTEIPIYIRKEDTALLCDPIKALAFFCPGKKFFPFEEDELALLHLLDDDSAPLTFGDTTFEVLHTPGHTAGCVCFLCSDESGRNIMFAGDTIFKDSIGRSDGYSGDPAVQLESLDKLKALTKDYIILPGHGEATTLDAEKRFNPFLSDF